MVPAGMLLIAAAALQPGAEAPLPFDPFTVEVHVAFDRDLAARDCRVEVHGAADPHWVENACRNVRQPNFMAMLGVPEDAAGRLTVLLALEAGGRADGPATAEGELSFRTQAEFTLSPSGAIQSCRTGGVAGNGSVIDLCANGLPKSGRRFAPAAGARNGRLSLSAFTLTAPRRDEAP